MAVADEGADALENEFDRSGANLSRIVIMGLQARLQEASKLPAVQKAVKGSKTIWGETTLDPTLAAPRTVVPGTIMTVGVRDAKERRAIIAFLLKR